MPRTAAASLLPELESKREPVTLYLGLRKFHARTRPRDDRGRAHGELGRARLAARAEVLSRDASASRARRDTARSESAGGSAVNRLQGVTRARSRSSHEDRAPLTPPFARMRARARGGSRNASAQEGGCKAIIDRVETCAAECEERELRGTTAEGNGNGFKLGSNLTSGGARTVKNSVAFNNPSKGFGRESQQVAGELAERHGGQQCLRQLRVQ